MPSSKAMENKTLAARCANAACGKQQSTETMVGVVVRTATGKHQIALCPACAESGWRPADSAAS